MELCSIASGSSGNCICVGSDENHVLIDAGISGKRIENGLNSIDLKTEEMQGVLVTHEHIDHISGLGVIARRYGLPIYATQGTIDAILNTKSVGKIEESLFHAITPDQPFEIGDLLIEPISISHDAADPVAYKIKNEEENRQAEDELQKKEKELKALEHEVYYAQTDIPAGQLISGDMVQKEIVQTEFDDSFFINASDLGSVAASIPIKAGTPLMKAFTGQVFQDPQDGDNDLPDLADLEDIGMEGVESTDGD